MQMIAISVPNVTHTLIAAQAGGDTGNDGASMRAMKLQH